MIQHLLAVLTKHLQDNLPEIKQIKLGPLTTPQTLPSMALYPAKFEIEQNVKNTNIIQPTAQKIQIQQEFQQELLIDIYDANMETLEKLASLTLDIIISDWDEIINTYNESIIEYISGSKKFTTKHLVNHIQLIEAIPTISGPLSQWQFKFKVNGTLQLSKEITGGGIIEKVKAPVKISEEKINLEIE
jgi:hypothetical protein